MNSETHWPTAVSWADGLRFGGYTDWRLPKSNTCERSNCTGSEMGHLWYVELGNTAGAMTNTGNFQNLRPGDYWSGTEYAPEPLHAWISHRRLPGLVSQNHLPGLCHGCAPWRCGRDTGGRDLCAHADRLGSCRRAGASPQGLIQGGATKAGGVASRRSACGRYVRDSGWASPPQSAYQA